MHWTTHLQRNKHPLQTQYYNFKELKPFCGKNLLENPKDRTRPLRSCNEEMQQLFACLKKWEYDNTHCRDMELALDRCTETNLAHMRQQHERIKKAGSDKFQFVASEDTKLHGRMTLSEINQLFRKYPQPDLGKPPYNVQKRLPHMSYGDDHFGKKRQKGWKS